MLTMMKRIKREREKERERERGDEKRDQKGQKKRTTNVAWEMQTNDEPEVQFSAEAQLDGGRETSSMISLFT
jgi:hypothetical protein